MRRFAAVLGLLVVTAGAVLAETKLVTLESMDQARDWSAVGRIEISGHAFCTGALISPDRVLTAAHCMFDRNTGEAYRPEQILFQADLRGGHAGAERRVRTIYVHPDYERDHGDEIARLASDIAIVQLDSPIQLSTIQPFELGSRPRDGQGVSVVSYAIDRAESPSIEKLCHVMASKDATVMMSCDIDFGSSGAPVFTFGPDGKARIVSVVTAKAEIEGEKVSFATSLELAIDPLMARIREGVPSSVASPPVVVDVVAGTTGAKFVKP